MHFIFKKEMPLRMIGLGFFFFLERSGGESPYCEFIEIKTKGSSTTKQRKKR